MPVDESEDTVAITGGGVEMGELEEASEATVDVRAMPEPEESTEAIGVAGLGKFVAAGVAEPEPPCDEPAATPPVDELIGVEDWPTAIKLGLGNKLSNVGTAAEDGIIPDDFVPGSTSTVLHPVDSAEAVGVGGMAGRVIDLSRSEGDGCFAWGTEDASLFVARLTITAAGTPIPAVKIPSDSVIRLRCSIASMKLRRRANWVRRRLLRRGRRVMTKALCARGKRRL